jgi:hypothetical protein
MHDRRAGVDETSMRRLSTLLGLVQEVAIAAWVLAAVWVALPGGAGLQARSMLAFVAGAVVIGLLAAWRRAIGGRTSAPAGAPTLG